MGVFALQSSVIGFLMIFWGFICVCVFVGSVSVAPVVIAIEKLWEGGKGDRFLKMIFCCKVYSLSHTSPFFLLLSSSSGLLAHVSSPSCDV